jgi:hypothetical protein
MKNLLILSLSLLVTFVVSGCGGAAQGVGAHLDKQTARTANVYVKLQGKSGSWVPDTIQEEAIEIDHKNKILGIAVLSGGRLALSGFNSRDGRGFQCRSGQAEHLVYCTQDTPFFRNTVGVRFKPYGGITFSTSNILSYIESHKLISLIENYADIVDYNNNKYRELVQKVNQQTGNLDKFVLEEGAKYRQKKPTFDVVIEDRTGVYDNSIEFKSRMNYRHNYIEVPKLDIGKMNIGPMSTNTKIDTKQWHKKIDAYYAQKAQDISKIAQEFQKSAKQKIKEQASYVMLEAYDDYNDYYTYTIEKNKKLYLSKNNKVRVTITKANVLLKYPIIKVKDSVLSISTDGKFTNNSNEFISIKSITYYLNNEIKTDTQFDKQSLLEIAPQSWIEVSKDVQSEKFKKYLYIENATAKELKKRILNYGIAVKYSMGDNAKTKTLYKTNKKPALEILKLQMKRK